MEFKLHKLSEGFIITSDEVVKYTEKWYNPITWDIGINWYKNEIPKEWSKTLKVIARQDQIDFSSLSEEEQKKIGWFDVEKITEDYIKNNYPSFIGEKEKAAIKEDCVWLFKKAQELLSDRMFTLEDMQKCFLEGNKYPQESKELPDFYLGNYFNRFIQSLSQPKSWDIKIEMEKQLCECAFEKEKDFCIYPNCLKQKLTNGKIKITKIL